MGASRIRTNSFTAGAGCTATRAAASSSKIGPTLGKNSRLRLHTHPRRADAALPSPCMAVC